MEQGALSVDIHDAAADTQDEQMLFGEPGEPSGEIWQNAEVSALFAQDTDIADVLRHTAAAIQLNTPLQYRLKHMEEQDWVRLTQSQFDPIQISSRLWIVPTWHQSPDPTAINLILDPGLAFGTGSHPTTRLCLQWLDRYLQPGDKVLDYGSGSGILAIAAMKLSAGHVTGIDIDPLAIEASQANALRNDCNPMQFEFLSTNQTLENKAAMDIVVANILANPLTILAPVLAQAVRPGGRIALSGILQQQAEQVNQVYQQWFDIKIADSQEDWVLLSGNKK